MCAYARNLSYDAGMGPKRRQAATDAWAALLRVHARVVPRLDQAMRSASGIPLYWYDVLLELAIAPDRQLRMTELGERVVLSRSRVSRIVDELVEAKLVSRQDNPDDRRSARACLTDAGLDRFRQAAPRYVAAIEAQFAAPLSEAELRAVAVALDKVAQSDIPAAGATGA
jgi:DNA-binding MarR family transcriptional regulator